MPDELDDLGNLSGYMRQGIREGISQRGMWDILSTSDFDISRSAVRSAYNEAREAMLNEGNIAALPWYRVPEADAYTEWSAGRAGRYVYQITLNVIDGDTGMTISRPWTVVSDEPISIQNAIDQAVDNITTGVAAGRYNNEEVESAELSGLYVTV